MAQLHQDNRYDRASQDVEHVTGTPAQTVEEFVGARRDFYLGQTHRRSPDRHRRAPQGCARWAGAGRLQGGNGRGWSGQAVNHRNWFRGAMIQVLRNDGRPGPARTTDGLVSLRDDLRWPATSTIRRRP